MREAMTKPWRAPVPVICVGNVTAGGSGKTPIVLALAEAALERGLRPGVISRGYGGCETGPVQVDPDRHNAGDVGDEPLMAAAICSTFVARDRAAAARLAVSSECDVLIMDDGMQNPSLVKDYTILVVRGSFGFGNGHLLPAGPLREPVSAALDRCDLVVVSGGGDPSWPDEAPGHIARSNLKGALPQLPEDTPLLAFAGIGFPENFFTSLRTQGAKLVDCKSFPDHHVYSELELAELSTSAEGNGAVLVTTRKDWVRLPLHWRQRVSVLDVSVTFEAPWSANAILEAGLEAGLKHGRQN